MMKTTIQKLNGYGGHEDDRHDYGKNMFNPYSHFISDRILLTISFVYQKLL